MSENAFQRMNVLRYAYAVLLAVLFILIKGYAFNSGDQAEHLPQIYRLFNPSLYKNDFFLTYYDQTFTVREYWVGFTFLIAKLINPEWACFLLLLISLSFVSLAWMKITELLTGNELTSFISPLFILIIFNGFTVGGNSLQANMFIGSVAAEVFACWGFVYFLKKNYFLSGLLIGIASLFQVLVGFQLFLILLIIQFCELYFNRKRIGAIVIFSLCFFLFAFPILFPILKRQFMSEYVYDQNLYHRILYVYRNVLHYLPSLFPIKDYLKLIFLCIVAVISISFVIRPFLFSFIRNIMAIILVGCFAYYILLQLFHINAVGKLQWFKTTIWLNAICCICISDSIAHFLGKVNFEINIKHVNRVWFISIILGLIIITQSAYLPLKSLQNKYHIGNYIKSDREKIHEWIKLNTAVDAMFLAPPDDDAFACEAQRPMVVNFKAVVHEPFFFMEWYKRMQDYYLVNFDEVGNNSAFKQAQFNYENTLKYPENNQARYRIDDVSKCKFIDILEKPVHREGNWILTQIQ
jgi:hypothetical protein